MRWLKKWASFVGNERTPTHIRRMNQMSKERKRAKAGGRHRVYEEFILMEEWRDGKMIWSLADANRDFSVDQVRAATPGETVAAIRRALRQSQAGFAQLLGVPVATVRGWEQNRREPPQASKRLMEVVFRSPSSAVKTRQIFAH